MGLWILQKKQAVSRLLSRIVTPFFKYFQKFPKGHHQWVIWCEFFRQPPCLVWTMLHNSILDWRPWKACRSWRHSNKDVASNSQIMFWLVFARGRFELNTSKCIAVRAAQNASDPTDVFLFRCMSRDFSQERWLQWSSFPSNKDQFIPAEWSCFWVFSISAL